MSTRLNPGPYDCLSKLQEDEPYFVLKASDPFAPFLVLAWAHLARGNITEATSVIKSANGLVKAGLGLQPPDKVGEAFGVSTDMNLWRTRDPLPTTGTETHVEEPAPATVIEEPAPAATVEEPAPTTPVSSVNDDFAKEFDSATKPKAPSEGF